MEKSKNKITFLAILISYVSISSAALSAPQELTIQNFDPEKPACLVRISDERSQCTSNECMILLLNGDESQRVQLNFSCLPTSAPTGFENPASDVELHHIRSKNTVGEIALTDGQQEKPSKPTRELNFCLYGDTNFLCGYATISRSKSGSASRELGAIKTFLQGIELKEGPPE